MRVLLVDCYNLLHTTMPPELAGLDEVRLCALLAGGVRGPWGRVLVVCDGAAKPHAPAGEHGGVELVYAGAGGSADDRIAREVEQTTTPRRVTVVSNDRAVQRTAKRRGCRVLTCEELIGKLAAAAARGQRGPTRGAPKPVFGDTNYWLRQFGVGDDRD